MTAPTLDLANQARRRARLAGVLGRLLLQEPGPDAAELVAGIPELEPLATDDADLASTYERLMLREVPLYESVFLGDDGQRGGPVVSDVLEWYRRHDFDEVERWRVPSGDHLGVELRFLSHLANVEAIAWEDDRPDEAARVVEAQRDFLALHLGQWAEIALDAVRRRAGDGPYAALSSAVTELLEGEIDRLRPAPDHDGMPAVASDPPPRHLGPARIARWLLAPGKAGAFLDVDDLADAALSIGVPWRPSDPRSMFRHVVESAIDGGDLDRLLARLRPAFTAARDSHAEKEESRDADRRVWRRWRLQADQTLALIDRLAERAAAPPPHVLVVVAGPGHTERTEAAMRVVAAVADLGRVAVSTDLRPKLAIDVASLLAAGAGEVLLAGGAVTAMAMADGGAESDRERRHLADAEIVVRLVPASGPVTITVEGTGTLADEVSARI